MPSFRHETTALIEHKLESLDRLSVTYTDAIQAMSQGDVEAASNIVEDAGRIIDQLQGWEEQGPAAGGQEPGSDEALTRLRTKARAVLDLHTRLLDALHSEQAQVGRQQKELSLGRRHLDSLQPEDPAGSILDSQG